MGGVGSSTSQRRGEEAPMAGPDYLMSLPPEMLDDILRRLPFEKLVGTCCLSPAWHRRWESVPSLDIWFSRGSSTARDRRFLLWPCAAPVHKFTVRSLWRCAAPIRSFTAHVQRRHSHRPARWLLALAHKRVEMLKLKFDEPWPAHSPRPPVVGPALYSCSTLTHLQLCGYCHLLRAPQGFAGFPNLFTLCLEYVVLPFHGAAAQLQLIISSAPHLTRLLLDDVMIGDEEAGIETCAIQAPNLRFLRLTMSLDNGCRIVRELPLLEVAQISIDPLFGTPNFINTFRRISSVKKLYLHIDSDQTMENPLERILWTFQNLRAVQQTANFGKFPSIMSIFSSLRFGPHIEKLKIQVIRPEVETGNGDAIDQDILDAVIYDDMFANLKHVSVDRPKYLPNDTWFMKFLLSKAGVLEYFFVSFNHGEETKAYVEACKELATCEKASPEAMLILRPRDKPTPDI
ncbi:hypothetical protein VPH35_071246 [Triticum aestivum]